eukprot:SAG31_NODE_2897_length_4936_cov_3.814348_2_plen_126_part_00
MGLLKGVDPLLTAELLYCLRSAGHGDEIAIVDVNFPAASHAATTFVVDPIFLSNTTLPQAVDAICSVFPIDFFVDCAVFHMAPSPGIELPPLGVEVHQQAAAALHKHAPDCVIKVCSADTQHLNL